MDLNETLRVDCDQKKVTYLKDSSEQAQTISLSGCRVDWLTLESGSNSLKVEEPGLKGVTFKTCWEERWV